MSVRICVMSESRKPVMPLAPGVWALAVSVVLAPGLSRVKRLVRAKAAAYTSPSAIKYARYATEKMKKASSTTIML